MISRFLSLLIPGTFILVSFNAFAQTGKGIIGKWKSVDEADSIQLEIFISPDFTYYGREVQKELNAKKAGALVLKDLLYDGKTNTYKGKMQPPNQDIEMSVVINMENKNRLRITAKKLWMTKKIYLTRI
jgi:hypothetical protein